MSRRFLNKKTPPHIMTLVLAASLSALPMNIFLPSLPGMAKFFETDYATVQLTVSLYLVSTALLQIIIGPASDRFGRRPVMLACFAIFLGGTVAAVYAPTIEMLLVCRTFQSFAAAGMVLSRAVIRDTTDAVHSASKIGYVTMGMSIVPMIGPVIGGFLDEWFGWQSTFLLMLAFGLLAFLVIYLDLGETNRATSSSFSEQFKAYPKLLSSRRFWGYTLTAAFTSGGFFAFLGGGPYVATELLGLSPSQYGFYFGIISVGYLIGNFCSGQLSYRIGINRMMLLGNIISSIGMVLSIALFMMGYNHPLSLFGPAAFTGIGNGVTLPNAIAGIVSVRSDLAGSASGLGGAMQIGGGAILSVVAGHLLGPDTGPYPLLWVMLLSSSAALLCTAYVMRVSREVGAVR